MLRVDLLCRIFDLARQHSGALGSEFTLQDRDQQFGACLRASSKSTCSLALITPHMMNPDTPEIPYKNPCFKKLQKKTKTLVSKSYKKLGLKVCFSLSCPRHTGHKDDDCELEPMLDQDPRDSIRGFMVWVLRALDSLI